MNTANRVIAIDVLLRPDDTMTARLRALNARLRQSFPEGFPLDEQHVPHVTLVQRYVPGVRLTGALDAVAKVLAEVALPDTLLATGYEIAPRTGIATVSVNVKRTPALTALQARLVDALASFTSPEGDASAFFRDPDEPPTEPSMIEYVKTFVPARIGERYEPHITVGRASADEARRLEAEGLEPWQFGIAGAAVFQLGNAGTARRQLWP